MGKMPVLWSMAVLKRIHSTPQNPLLLPYLEKVCDRSNPGLFTGPRCNQRMFGRKAMEAGVRQPQIRNVRRHQKLKQEHVLPGTSKGASPFVSDSWPPKLGDDLFLLF